MVIHTAAKASASIEDYAVKDVIIEFIDEAPGPDYAFKVNNESAARILEKARSPYLFVTHEAKNRTAMAVERERTPDLERINFFLH